MPAIPQAYRTPTIIGSIVVVAICVIFIARTCGGPPTYTKVQLERLETDAELSAAATAEFLPEGAKVLVLHLDVPGAQGLKEHKESFVTVLRGMGVDVEGIEAFQPAGAGMGFNPLGWAYSISELREMAARCPQADTIVSLAGAPYIGEDRAPDDLPRLLVAFVPGAPPALQELFDYGVLDMAIVRRGGPKDPPPATPQERFDRYFQIVTPETEDLPYLPLMPGG
jgi:hypothetical protein